MNDKNVKIKVANFFSQFRKKHYKKGELLLRADEEPTGVFYLRDGVVKQYAISKKGEELILNVFKSVAFFPMGWAINNTRNDYYYEALTDVEVYIAPAERVIEFMKSNSDVMYDLVTRIYRGLDGLFTRMTYMMSGAAYDKLVTEIVIQAKRFGKPKTDGVIELHVSEKELAAQAGMTRETVSREIKNLKEKGIVSFTKNMLVIHNFPALENELESR